MKYIKTFEVKKEYNIGDTVVFKFQRTGGVFDIKVGIIKEKGVFNNWWIITDLDNRIYGELDIRNSHILKKASQKDIDKYMLDPISKKYNI